MSYLDDAMKNLGKTFDYAVNCCERTADEFARLFVATGIAVFFGKRNSKYISDKSGTDLVMDIIYATGEHFIFPEAQI